MIMAFVKAIMMQLKYMIMTFKLIMLMTLNNYNAMNNNANVDARAKCFLPLPSALLD